MNAKSIVLLLLALGCGLVASIGITKVMAKRGSGSSQETQAIFVVTEKIPFGQALTPELLRQEEWPKDKIPEGAPTKMEDVEGRYARDTFYPGEPVIDSKLYEKGAPPPGVSSLIPPGYKVVTVEVDKNAGMGLIRPGDRVDLMWYVNEDKKTGIQRHVRDLLKDVKVFAVGDDYQLDNEKEEKKGTSSRLTKSSTVRLLVTPIQAKKVLLAKQAGKIGLVMRSQEAEEESDSANEEANFITLDDLLNRRSETGNREEEDHQDKTPNLDDLLNKLKQQNTPDIQQPGSGVLNSPEPTEHSMRIISGGQVGDMNLVLVHERGAAGSSRWRTEEKQFGTYEEPTEAKIPRWGSADPSPPSSDLAPSHDSGATADTSGEATPDDTYDYLDDEEEF